MRRAFGAAAFVVAASLLAELAFRDSAHAEFWWHRLPLFDFVYGLSGCVAIVLASKWLGKAFVQKSETYYEDEARR